jgi:nucleoside 2-deoxyribosyltransferase
MKIAISGNVYMLSDIMEVQKQLEAKKHVVIPTFENVGQMSEKDENKKKQSRMSFFNKLKECDALLILNNSLKNGRKNYISGSSFLEMGFANALGKKIFLLQGVPDLSYKDEILAMKPMVLNGKLEKIR